MFPNMDKTTNSSNSQNLNESNKKGIDFTFLMIIILILISTFASAKTKYGYYQRNKKNQPITIGVQSGLVQRTMIYNINNYEQKYLEMAHRISIEKKFNKGLSLELGYYNSFTNNAPNTNYSYSDNNTIISLSSVYHIKLLPKLSLDPKVGVGLMLHHDHKYVNNEQLVTNQSRMQVVQIGGSMRFHINEYIAFGSGAEIIYGNKNHVFPYAYSGLYVNFMNNAAAKYKRCPSKF